LFGGRVPVAVRLARRPRALSTSRRDEQDWPKIALQQGPCAALAVLLATGAQPRLVRLLWLGCPSVAYAASRPVGLLFLLRRSFTTTAPGLGPPAAPAAE
jgi:hypothetical protein